MMVFMPSVLSCSHPVEIVEGGLYSIENGDGSFGISKVLVVEGDVVHARVYKNRFEKRPQSIDPENLDLGSVNDPDGFGMGHLPLSRGSFVAWEPTLLAQVPVLDEELEGYELGSERCRLAPSVAAGEGPRPARPVMARRRTPRCTGRRRETFSPRRPPPREGVWRLRQAAVEGGAGELNHRWADETLRNACTDS